MKKIVILLCLICSGYLVNAQNTYTIDGKTLELKTEAEGSIDLLWNVIDGQYRYFIRTEDGNITELTNTKNADKKFDEAYKTTLNNATLGSNLSTEKLKFTLFSLRNFIDAYNASVDTSYASTGARAKLQTRLLIFGGITNSPFVENPDNKTNPVFGAEFEFTDTNKLSRHALFFQIKHVLNSDEFDYTTTQLGLGYRFRFIQTNTFNLYANVIAATYNFSKSTVVFLDENDMIVSEQRSANSFDVPFIFGIGADIKVSDQSFITLTYDELFAAFLDNQGNFSTHIALGYKFNL